MNNTVTKKETLDPLVLKSAIILVFGVLAPLLDSTMVNVALKTIALNFNTNISVVQWITTGYVLAMGLSVPISSWAVNRFGCKKIYLFSLLLFLIGSIMAFFSWNIQSLICFAVIQGVGAGIMMPTFQTALVQISGGSNLGRIMSIVSIPALLGPILGPVLGGILVNVFGWRSIFFVNIPICIIAFVLTCLKIPSDKKNSRKARLDILGLLMVSPAFSLLIFGISKTAKYGNIYNRFVMIPLISGLLLTVLFIIYSLKTKKDPVLKLQLFRSKNFCISNMLLFLTGTITNGAMLLLPLYFQNLHGANTLYAGLWLIPQGLGMLLTRGWVGRVADRDGSRKVSFLSLIATLLGTIPFIIAGSNTNLILVSLALLVRGAGLGGLLIAIMASAYSGLDKEDIPYASTTTRILQTIGGAFGSAILSAVIQSQSTGYEKSFQLAFFWVTIFTLAATILSLFLPKRTGL